MILLDVPLGALCVAAALLGLATFGFATATFGPAPRRDLPVVDASLPIPGPPPGNLRLVNGKQCWLCNRYSHNMSQYYQQRKQTGVTYICCLFLFPGYSAIMCNIFVFFQSCSSIDESV